MGLEEVSKCDPYLEEEAKEKHEEVQPYLYSQSYPFYGQSEINEEDPNYLLKIFILRPCQPYILSFERDETNVQEPSLHWLGTDDEEDVETGNPFQELPFYEAGNFIEEENKVEETKECPSPKQSVLSEEDFEDEETEEQRQRSEGLC